MARFVTLTALNVNDAIPDAWVDEVKAAHDYLIFPGTDIPSGTTLAITNEFHGVTGTVTIDNISDSLGAATGQQVWLYFKGATTIRNNGGGTGNIRTSLGADMPVAVGDVIMLIYDGTFWRQASRNQGLFTTLGYVPGIGVGGTVTQITSRATAVTLNKICGAIITNGTSLANGATATFVVNNSLVAATDVVLLAVQNNPATGCLMDPSVVAVTAGTFSISYGNTTGAATTATLTIGFVVLKVPQT